MILLITTTSLQAQADSTRFIPKTYVGVQYGMNWNEVMFSPSISQTLLAGNRLAAVFRYVGQKHLGVQLELAYDQRGWAEASDTLATDYTRQLDYLDLVAYTHISIGNGKVRPVILLGSYLSYPLSQKETIPDGLNPNLTSYYGEPIPERIQYGLAAGLGFELLFGKFSIQLDGRYQAALSGIFPSTDARFIFSNSRGLSAQASVLFRIFGE
jgi:hypothetical protein